MTNSIQFAVNNKTVGSIKVVLFKNSRAEKNLGFAVGFPS